MSKEGFARAGDRPILSARFCPDPGCRVQRKKSADLQDILALCEATIVWLAMAVNGLTAIQGLAVVVAPPPVEVLLVFGEVNLPHGR